jgi:DNA-binding NarL/FixJ family response regulator
VARARELSPSLVLLDVMMPELNGIEARALLREECPAARILALSMHSERNLIVGC